MHNLHLVVINAESGFDACNRVEAELADWGTENNWRTMCGAVSQDNEVHQEGDGRYGPDDDCNTIEKINAMVSGWVKSEPWTKSRFDRLMSGEEMTAIDWWGVRDYAKHMYEKVQHTDEDIDVLNGFTYFEFEYNECGVTQLDNGDEPFGENEKKWVVFVDMHS